MAVSQGAADTLYAIILGGVIAIGPELGHYALIVFGALIGAMHSMAKTDFGGNNAKAVLYLLRWIGTACVLTHALAALLVQSTGFQADRWPGVIAFLITFLADKWPEWVDRLGDWWVKSRTNQP